jgi:hypothetical protein
MGSETKDLLNDKKSSECAPGSGIEQCAQDMTQAHSGLVRADASPATLSMLPGVSIEQLTTAGKMVGSTAAVAAIGGAGVRAAGIAGERFMAVVSEPIWVFVADFYRVDRSIAYSVTDKVFAEPYGPRMLRSGLKAGLYGAAAGLTAYGLYEGYNYLTSDKK